MTSQKHLRAVRSDNRETALDPSAASTHESGGGIEARDRHVAPADTPAADDQAAPQENPGRRRRPARKAVLSLVLVSLLGAAGWYGHGYWTEGRFMISTDDAYVQADISEVSPKIQGYVAAIAVEENQRVEAGDILFRLDDGDYRIALDDARAKLATHEQTLKRLEAQTDAAQASVRQAEAQKQAADAALRNAELSAGRAQNLRRTNVISQAQLDDAQAALDQAKANLAGAEAQIASAEANVAVLEAQYQESLSQRRSLELAVEQAERNLSFTELRAPFDGVVGNVAAHEGDLVSPGQNLAAIVPLRELYVAANFKETQLADIVPGETVHMTIDALPDLAIEGTVTSLAPASGSVFSLLPPENATGNFTKVVQRIPVRITLPADVLADGRIKAGMSVIVDVDSRTAPDGTTAHASR